MKIVDIALPSNKKFGYFFSSVFAFLAFFFLIKFQHNFFTFFALLTIITLILSVFKSDILRPFNLLWMRLGYFLGIILKPIILSLIFFIIITPIAMITRFFGRDELRIKLQDCDSHWKTRSPLGPDSSSFKQQF